MHAIPPVLERDIEAVLQQHEAKSLLRFITCGSVDDGKSTLIGRLLYESELLYEDQLAVLAADSRRWGTAGDEIDFALLVDGLAAEREQGITIDVAYRYFSTSRRKFIVADTPGHEQYTRNMITGASTAELAVILVDARKGVQVQTRRHSHLIRLIGIEHVVLAVNKLDLVDYASDAFERVIAEYGSFAARIGIPSVTAVPISALRGDNVVRRSERMPWYEGPTLIEILERCELDETRLQRLPMRLPVQWVNRCGQDFRAYCGLLAGGRLRAGDALRVLPSGREARVAAVSTAQGDVGEAVAGQSVMVTLEEQIDISRGDMLCAVDAPCEVADQFECTVIWMTDEPMLPGRPYWIKLGPRLVGATVGELKYRVDVNSLEHLAARTLELNAIGVCTLSLSAPVAFDPYANNRETGGFILIDRLSNSTAAAGLLHFALRRAHNIHPQALDVDKPARAALMGQKPAVVWLTGLSGAGKSTIANHLARRLHATGHFTYVLDGDNVRHGLNRDLGFTDADRVENVRRVAEVARLMVDAGLIVVCALISPYRAERRLARERFADGEFIEVFVDVPLPVAEARDVKGLYAKARAGQLPRFTGIDSPYERPETPELRLDTQAVSAELGAERIVHLLRERGIVR